MRSVRPFSPPSVLRVRLQACYGELISVIVQFFKRRNLVKTATAPTEMPTGITVDQRDAWSARNFRLLLLALLSFVFVSGFFHVSDVDVGYHIRTGAHIWAGNGIPAVNTFAHTVPDDRWLLQQWWPGVMYYLAYSAGGLSALIVLKTLIATTLMFLVWGAARQETDPRSFIPFWVVTFGVLIARMRFFERPDLVSATLFALIFLLDRRYDTNRRWQWIGLPLLMALWSNTHAGAMYGFVFLTVAIGSEWLQWFLNFRADKDRGSFWGSLQSNLKSLSVRIIGALLSLVAAYISLELINPNGFDVLLVPIEQFNSAFWQEVIMEYHAPDWATGKWFYISLALLAVLQSLTWRKLHLRLFLTSAAFAYLACSSQRSVLVYTIVALPHAAYMLKHLKIPQMNWSVHRQMMALPACWAAIVVFLILPNKTFLPGIGYYPPFYPISIYRFIEKNVPPQNLFNDMQYGGSMLWFLYPNFRPYIDGRGDTYTPEFWQKEYLPVLNADANWADLFEKYDVHGVLLPIPKAGKIAPIGSLLSKDTNWATVAFNDYAILFLERTEQNRQVIAENEFKLLTPLDPSLSGINPTNLTATIAEANRALKLEPDSVFALTALARAEMVGGNYESASQRYAQLVKLDRGDIYRRDYAYCLYMANRTAEAEEIFRSLTKNKEMAGFAHYMLHFVAVKRGDMGAALDHLAAALQFEPQNAQYQNARAQLESLLLKKN
jgi:tetratricopeptide (TPR) repeat protein